METRKIIEKSIGSNQITVVTNKLPEISITEINPYEPFKGEDGNTYSIEYDNRLNGYTNCYAFAMGDVLFSFFVIVGAIFWRILCV